MSKWIGVTSSGLRATRRIARKPRLCVTCGRFAQVGEPYVLYTVFPNHDVLGADAPYQFFECNGCDQERAARRSA